MDLLVLEACAALFLLLSILRPVFKGLWGLSGIALMPLLALGIIVGLFPVYGFRPECVPLFFFVVYMTIIDFSAAGALFSRIQSDDYRDRRPVTIVVNVVLFGFAVWTAVYFGPPLDVSPYSAGTLYFQTTADGNVSPADAITLRDRSRGAELWLRVFVPAPETAGGAEKAALRPLLALIPPVAGSVQVTNAVCAALGERGFTVLTYSRPGFDSPAVAENGEIRRLSLPGLYRLAGTLIRGLGSTTANSSALSLEDGRKQDIVFLLEELSRNQSLRDSLPSTDLDCVFLAGYGAGGAALTVLSAAPDFTEKYSRIKGIIAVESPVFSDENVRPALPALFIVSDRITRERGGRYKAILKTVKASRAPALTAALSGAGPFDYSDSPRLYPVYSFLFRGAKTEVKRDAAEFPALTASLMANFAAFIMAQPDETPPPEQQAAAPEAGAENAPAETAPSALPPVKTALSGVYLETGGGWNLGDSRIILQP